MLAKSCVCTSISINREGNAACGISMKVIRVSFTILFVFMLFACAATPASSAAISCREGLAAAYQELDFAKAKGLDGTVEYAKAASLLGAAKIQEEFGKYPNCIEKVERARRYIDLSVKSD